MALINVPIHLKRQLEQGAGVVFIGTEVSHYSGLPSIKKLTNDVLTSTEIKNADADFFHANRYYQNTYDLTSLRTFVSERIESDNAQLDWYLEIAKLPIKVYVTTCMDDLLERALISLGKKFQVVIQDSELPYLSDDTVFVIKLLGDLKQRNSMILTNIELSLSPRKKKKIYEFLWTLFERKTFLLLGYDLKGAEAQFVLDQFEWDSGEKSKKAYLVDFDVPDYLRKDKEGLGIELLSPDSSSKADQQTELLEFLRALPKSVDQGIPTQKLNEQPIYSMAEEVKGLLKSMGHSFREVIHPTHRMFVATRKTNGSWSVRLYLCAEGNIGTSIVESVTSVLAEKDQQDVSTAWIITHNENLISEEAKVLLKSNPRIKALSLTRFYHTMIDFSEYLDKLVEDFHFSRVAEFYTNIPCSVPQYDKGGKVISYDHYENIDSYLEAWLATPSRNHISILGEYGSGKTWFCKHFAAKLAIKYKENPYSTRIPIFIQLGAFKQVSKVEDLIISVLVNKYGVDLPGGFSTFQHLNKYDHLLLIFDGFDEMSLQLDFELVKNNFYELAKVIQPGSKSKAVLTSRTSLFRTEVEEKTLLGGGEDALIDVTTKPNFDVVYIENLSKEKIKAVLRKRRPSSWEKDWNQINSIYGLKDLAIRPVFLPMILDALEDLKRYKKVNIISLYDSFIRTWLNKQNKEKRALFKDRDKLKVLDDLAWFLYSENINSVHFEDLPSKRIFSGLKGVKKNVSFAYDLQSQSLLTRDSNGYYKFSHQSFVDYFVAKRLTRDVLSGDYKNFGGEYISNEVFSFMRDLMYQSENRAKLIKWIVSPTSPVTVKRNSLHFLLEDLDPGTSKVLKKAFNSEMEFSVALRIAIAFHKANDDSLLESVALKLHNYEDTTRIPSTKRVSHSLSFQRGQNLSIRNVQVLKTFSDALLSIKNQHILRTLLLVLGHSSYKGGVEAVSRLIQVPGIEPRTLRYAIIAFSRMATKQRTIDLLTPFLKYDDPVVKADVEGVLRPLMKE